MFNAEDIIELEKKWLKYKIKQKSKFYVLLLLILSCSYFIVHNYFLLDKPKQIVKKDIVKIVKPETHSIIKTVDKNIEKLTTNKIQKKDNNKTIINKKSNQTTKKIETYPKTIEQKIITKPYHFKLKPTEQGNELFSSNGVLLLNLPYKKNETIQLVRDVENKTKTQIVTKNQKPKISINMQEIDAITYLKEKYYATSSIVFALMLCEKYYNAKEYKNSLKWSLTANDIDAQNEKSWYWFAKSKIKLKKKNDAIRALQAYLKNNQSKKLKTLLRKIEHGDLNDQ